MRWIATGVLLLGGVGCGSQAEVASLARSVDKLRAEVRQLREELAARPAAAFTPPPVAEAPPSPPAASPEEASGGTAAAATAPTEAGPDTERASAAESGDGRLQLVTRPYSEVYIEGRRVGQTPLLNLRLPAGSHELSLRNEEAGLESRVRVRIRPGETTRLNLALQ